MRIEAGEGWREKQARREERMALIVQRKPRIAPFRKDYDFFIALISGLPFLEEVNHSVLLRNRRETK